MAENIDRRDFFISFNSADLAYAEAIDAALRAESFTTYFHPKDLLPGGNVPAWMEEALMNSTQTLALFSPNYVKDKAVYSFTERYASLWQDPDAKERKLIPIVLQDVQFTPIMAMLSRIEVIGMTPQDVAALVIKRLKMPDETKKRDAAQAGLHLPQIFHVAYRPNPNFTGRFEALESLQKSLRAGNAAITAVAGMGGIGKTTLAAEYCHRFGSRYGGVWWIRSEQESVMLSDLVELGQRLGIAKGKNIETDVRATLENLTSRAEPWLLVYDNAPNPDAVGKHLPAGNTRCIITSRRSDFDEIANVTPLDQWSNVVTTDYLLSRTGREDAAGASRLAKDLGGLPLAAEQAAAFLRMRKGISFDAYASDIAELIKHPKPLGATGDYPDTVYGAFVKSLETLQQMDHGETARDILRLCAFFSPDGVSLGLLTVEWGRKVLPALFARAMADSFVREDALAALTSLSLLRQEEGSSGMVLIFHRLLLEVVRDWVGEAARVLWGTAALNLIAGAFPYEVPNPKYWPLCSLLMPHVAPLEMQIPRSKSVHRALGFLLNQASIYLSVRGDFAGALELSEKSVFLTRSIEEPLALSAALNNLGLRYDRIGRLEAAERNFREALTIEEPLLESNDPNLAITLSHVGQVTGKLGKFVESEGLLRRVVDIMKVAYGANSAEYAHALSDLGMLYGVWSRLPGQTTRRAREKKFKTKALILAAAARGTRHPQVAQYYANFAQMMAREGDWPEAVARMERSVAIVLSLDLAQHPDTHAMVRELSLFWEQLGQADKAARLKGHNISDLLPVIAQIEGEHRAWVAEDPEKRHFGPPSPFESQQGKEHK